MPKGIYKHKPLSEEHKRKLSEAHMGKHFSEETKRKIGYGNRGKVRSEEVKERWSESHKGIKYPNRKSPNVSKEKELARRKKISKALKGRMPEYPVSFKGQHHSDETKRCLSKLTSSKLGNKSPAWKGGLTPLGSLIRTNFEYRQWRSDVFTRDNFTCQECDIRGDYLHAHHIKSFSSILQFYEITTIEEALKCAELWNINNGITLCKKCHKLTYKKN